MSADTQSETVVAVEVIEHVLARAHQTADANEARAVFHVARSIADELAQTDPGFDPVRFIEASTDRS
jgi:hypothetical protein